MKPKEKPMARRRSQKRRRPAIIWALLLLLCSCQPVLAAEIILGTRAEGTFSHYVGQTLCRLISASAGDMTCRVMPGQDPVHVLTNLSGGSLDIGLVDTSILLEAVRKEGRFEFMGLDYSGLRLVLPVYDVPVSLIVRQDAGIGSLEDLAGKRVNAGLPGSNRSRLFELLMAAKGWSRDDFALLEELPSGSSEESMAFCHGTIEAMLHVGIHPDPWLDGLLRRCPADLTGLDDQDIDRVIESETGYFQTELAAGAYPVRPARVRTFGSKVVLVASEDLEARTVCRLLEAIAARQAQLRSAHPAFSDFSPETAGLGLDRLRLHQGAAGCFKNGEGQP